MIKLPVPYRSQWDVPDADWSKNDCGSACIASMIEAYFYKYVPVDEIAVYTGTIGLVTWDNLQYAASVHSLYLVRSYGISAASVREHIKNRQPVIFLVAYGEIPPELKQDQVFTGGHFMLAVGATDDSIIYHDPNWKDGQTGDFIEISDSDFNGALTGTRSSLWYPSSLPYLPIEQEFDMADEAANIMARGRDMPRLVTKNGTTFYLRYYPRTADGKRLRGNDNDPTADKIIVDIWIPNMEWAMALGYGNTKTGARARMEKRAAKVDKLYARW